MLLACNFVTAAALLFPVWVVSQKSSCSFLVGVCCFVSFLLCLCGVSCVVDKGPAGSLGLHLERWTSNKHKLLSQKIRTAF